MFVAVLIFTIADIVESKFYKLKKDLDEQARFGLSLQHALCVRKLRSTMQSFTILHTSDERRRLLLATLCFAIAYIVTEKQVSMVLRTSRGRKDCF